MSSPFALQVDLSQLGMAEASAASEAAARPAAQAGAQVFYDQVRRNVLALGRKTGKLADAIYQAHSADNSSDGHQVYHVSWNAAKAKHGHLVEDGYIQRYELYRDEAGRVRPRVRPEKQGTSPPGPRASRAAKDAYYVPLATPRRIPGKAFVASAAVVAPQALSAMEAEFYARMGLHLQ